MNFHSRHITFFLQFLIGLTLLVLLNGVVNKFIWRIDLTEEKRYSISRATQQLLRNLDETIFIEVYLEGDINADFKRLQKGIKETLDEFKVYAGNKLQYEFVNPDIAESKEARNEYYRSLMNKGIMPTNVEDRRDGKKVEKLIFPGAVVNYGGEEKPVMLLKGNSMEGARQAINQSLEGLEFEFASVIRQLSSSERKRVALVQGYGETKGVEIEGMRRLLMEHYDVNAVNIRHTPDLTVFDACIWIQPKEPYQDEDLYKIDQYLMHGGKLIFFNDALQVHMDSITDVGHYAFPYETNLNDLFFRYGLRQNQNLLQDVNSGNFPLVTGQFGGNPQIRQVPWPFYPILNKYATHPIVRNIDAVYGKFVSSIDTVKAIGVKKTPLIFTSAYTRELQAPVRVNFNDLRTDIVPEAFNLKYLPIAYLVEGEFDSYYKNKFLPDKADQDKYIAHGRDGKLILVGDGNIPQNEINRKNGTAFPLGLDPYSNTTYANDDLLINMLAYLTDEGGIINARNKEIRIRPLDKVKVSKHRNIIQLINIVLPVFLILLFGVIRMMWRKHKYAR